jgi:hypothetical protein
VTSSWLRRRSQDPEPQHRLMSPYEHPLALTDGQLSILMQAAAPLDLQKRGDFLERIAGRLRRSGSTRATRSWHGRSR